MSVRSSLRKFRWEHASTFLPTCSAIVHHGGSGTTAAPLHYAVPQLVLPSFADNPMSAQRVVDRGVGLTHDPRTLDVPTARALVDQLLTDSAIASAAREVSAEMVTQPSPSSVIQRVGAALDSEIRCEGGSDVKAVHRGWADLRLRYDRSDGDRGVSSILDRR